MKKEMLSFLWPYPPPPSTHPTPLLFLFMAQVLIQASLEERQVCCLHQLAMVGKRLLLLWNLNSSELWLSIPFNMAPGDSLT